MNRFNPWLPAGALASAILLGAAPALAQQGSDDAANVPQQQGSGSAGAAPDAKAAQPSTPSGSALPGVVLERNVFVPVDAAGKPTSNQFIVVERRELSKEGDSGTSSGDAAATSDVPTRFILVPQQAGDGSGGDADDGDSSGAPQ